MYDINTKPTERTTVPERRHLRLVHPSTAPTGRDPITGAWTDEDDDAEYGIENELYVEVSLPDGSVARWWRDTDDDVLVDRLTTAIEAVIGSPDTVMT